MSPTTRTLTTEQVTRYRELGYLDALPVLSADEVRKYRADVERTCDALGGNVARLDDIHQYFRWAWELGTHPQLVGYLRQLLGPDIVITVSNLFYKPGHSGAFVGWHQDGITEEITDARCPTTWLGITESTAENGCLRVVPRSQHVGLLPHEVHAAPAEPPPGWEPGRALGDELSGLFVGIPPGLDPPHDVEMRAGEMSIHHPILFHGSNPNRSDGPRIGFAASYSAADLLDKRKPVTLVCGDPPPGVEVIAAPPPAAAFEDEIAAYRAGDSQIHYAR